MALNVDPLLEGWSTWLFGQPGALNAANDPAGAFVTNSNAANNPWFIPGTWGTIQPNARRIVVPHGMPLYIVAGSSHATDDEINAGAETLEQYATWVDSLWYQGDLPVLTIDGKSVGLSLVRTDPFNVTFDQTNQYYTMNTLANIRQQMVSVGRVYQFTPTNEQSFAIFGSKPAARGQGHGRNGERTTYRLFVEYVIVRP